MIHNIFLKKLIFLHMKEKYFDEIKKHKNFLLLAL